MTAPDIQAAAAVTRLLLDDWIPDLDRQGWWHIGSGMQGPGEPMTDPQREWIEYVDGRA